MSIKISNLTNKKNGRDYSFADIHLDFSPKQASSNTRNSDIVSGNDIEADYDEKAIMNSLRNILTQRRYLNPSFGVNIKKYIGGSVNDLTSKAIGTEIDRGITLFEPRVKVEKIIVLADPDKFSYYISIAVSLPNFQKIFYYSGVLDNIGNFNFINN